MCRGFCYIQKLSWLGIFCSMRALTFPLILATLCLSFVWPSAAASEGHPVRIAEVEKKPVQRSVSTYGVLAPRIEELSFRTGGRIASFNATEGQRVVEGQVLAELEKRDAQSQLDQAEVVRDQAARQLERFEKLAKEGMIQESQLENAYDQLETAKLGYEQARLELDRCTLRAPGDGFILKEYLDSRTTVTAGTPIYSFRDVSRSWITKVELTDQNAFAFGLGTTAKARFAPYPGEVFNGTLTKQAGVADKNNGLYTVEITIETNEKELRPGMVVEVDLLHETEESYSTVPLDALVDLRGNSGIIYLLDESGSQAIEMPVHIVAITAGMVAFAEPVPEGTPVVVRGQQSLRHGAPVKII